MGGPDDTNSTRMANDLCYTSELSWAPVVDYVCPTMILGKYVLYFKVFAWKLDTDEFNVINLAEMEIHIRPKEVPSS